MDRTDAEIAFEAATTKLSEMLADMRHGALDGCDPTWAAHFAASTHEAITCINSGIQAQERVEITGTGLSVEQIQSLFAKQAADDTTKDDAS